MCICAKLNVVLCGVFCECVLLVMIVYDLLLSCARMNIKFFVFICLCLVCEYVFFNVYIVKCMFGILVLWYDCMNGTFGVYV